MAFNQFPYSNFHELNLDWILNELKTLSEKVESISGSQNSERPATRNIVIIGDSYGTNNGGGVIISKPYPLIIQESTHFNNVFSACKNGAGFANGGFLEMLNSLSVPETVKITDVIVLGGWNDRNYTYSQLSSAMTEFRNTAQQQYPHAVLQLGFISFGYEKLTTDQEYATLMACRTNYFSVGQSLGYVVYKNLQWIMRNRELMIADGSHPNQQGMNEIANGVISCLLTGNNSVQYWRRWTNSDFVIDSAFTESSAPSTRPMIEEELNNGITQMHLFNFPGFGWQLTFKNPLEIAYNGQEILLGTYPQYLIRGFGEISRIPTMITSINSDDSYLTIPASLYLNNGHLYIETYWTKIATKFTSKSIIIANADGIVYDYQER